MDRMSENELREWERENAERRRVKLQNDLTYIRKHYWVFPDWFWYGCLLIGIVCAMYWMYFRHNPFILIGLFAACYGVGQLAYRGGFLSGYIESQKDRDFNMDDPERKFLEKFLSALKKGYYDPWSTR